MVSCWYGISYTVILHEIPGCGQRSSGLRARAVSWVSSMGSYEAYIDILKWLPHPGTSKRSDFLLVNSV